MDDRAERIENKVDKISERLGSIDSTLAAQHESLREHMRRTANLEAAIIPLNEHVMMVNGALKLIALIALLVGIADGVHKLFK